MSPTSFAAGLLVGLVVLQAAPLRADELEASSSIEAVTVYADRAEITRSVEAGLEVGAHALRVEGLPLAAIRESVRVEHVSGALEVAAVTLREVQASELVHPREEELTREIHTLEIQKRIRADRIEAQRLKLEFIRKIVDKSTTGIDEGLGRGTIEPDRWREGWKSLTEGADEALEAIRLAEEDQRELEQRIDKLERERAQLATGARASFTAVVDLFVRAPGAVELRLIYQVTDVGWQPLYDARLDTERGRLVIEQQASVSQSTGEDWSDVALKLSTSTPIQGDLPVLGPWRIDVLDDRPMPMAEATSAFDKAEVRSLRAAAPAPVRADAVVGAFSARYDVRGTVDIPADGSSHRVLVDRLEEKVTLHAEAVPKLQPAAWLVADLTYGGEAPLPAGTIDLFRDGSFVGSSWLPRLSPGETRRLSFGVDDRIDVDYRLDTGMRSSEGIISSYERSERHYVIEVVSHHREPIELIVRDQLPVPQDERIEVETTRETTPIDERDVGPDGAPRRGIVTWKRTLAPDERLVLRLGYAVTHPEDVRVGGF
ncbi:MAG: mucoidy inhibitor MuiA family protein [Geminicoccaceae bacterium]|nr:mucoidy inhibitor MuiA family protein [Geminicoccaceae bacterium]